MQNYVRAIRERKGMTLEDVARAIGVTKAQVSKLERGIIRLNDQWLDRLAQLYHCSIHELIDDDAPERLVQAKPGSRPGMGVSEFIVAPVVGTVDVRQVGLVEDWPHERQYSLRFSTPKSIAHLGGRVELYALNLTNGGYDNYTRDSQLIFAKIQKETQSLVTEGSVVIAAQKDNQGRISGYFLRVIERDMQGFPYAVFKIRHGRNAATTLANTLLAGNIDIYELMQLQQKADDYRIPKKPVQRPIPVENNGLDIVAVLVKSIRDE